tara:strand:+ start:1526 stop:1852 length:327 start_codon:yes stop_codon:yes gene_type:complete
MAKKLKKYQSEGSVNRDAVNNNIIAYFNSLERSDPGPMGDGPPPPVKPVIEEANTTVYDNIKYPKGRKVAPRFEDGGSWEGLGKKDKPKKIKYKKNKKSKPNRKTGLY